MGWFSKSSPAVVEAVVAAFRDAAPSRLQLPAATSKDWERSEFWLDTSGLALYFLDRIRSTGRTGDLPAGTLERLGRKLAQNRERIEEMRQEFIALNHSFQGAGVSYCNLKGFTLTPHSCPDLSLRYQSDYDFLIDSSDLETGRQVLERHGFVLTASTPRTLEFKNPTPRKISFDGQYRTSSPRSAELHIALDCTEHSANQAGRDERLDRITGFRLDGEIFPALSEPDQMTGQALHILGHLRGEHTRPSWLLEYRRHILTRRDDPSFWTRLRELAEGQPEATIALGLSTMLAAQIFGESSLPQLDSWTLDVLPLKVRMWGEAFGRRAVLADVPGTKLYLLLEEAMHDGRRSASVRAEATRRLLPASLPPRIMPKPAHDRPRLRLQREIMQMQYFFYRLIFHLRQNFVFAIERRRWRTLLDGYEKSCHMSHEDASAGQQSSSRNLSVCDDT